MEPTEDCIARTLRIREVVEPLPGATPYVNRRPMFVGGRFDGRSLKEFFVERHPHLPLEGWREAAEAGRLSVDGAIVRSLEGIVRAGSRIEQEIPDTVEPDVDPAIEFLYEDESLIVLRKPAPLPVHPCGRFNRNTVVSLLLLAFPTLVAKPVHRLDVDTTGLLVMAKNRDSARVLGRQFEARSVKKSYLARVHGKPREEYFSCSLAIEDARGEGGTRRVRREESAEARLLAADTQCRRIAEEGGQTILDVRPHSGRTNQIRLHLAALGFPLVGDRAYGKEGAEGVMSGEGRLCLHAWRLELEHPRDGRKMVFEADPPAWVPHRVAQALKREGSLETKEGDRSPSKEGASS